VTVDHDSRARTHLANERTFLAWFRTGITLVALGLAAAQFLQVEGEEGAALVRGLATVVIGTGAFVVIVGLSRYREGRRRIDAEAFRPAWVSITIAAVAALLTAALGIAFVWLLPQA
jgi:putative membrane protein